MININFAIRPSKYFLLFIILMHVLALFAIFLTAVSFLIQLLLFLLLLLSFYYSGYLLALQKAKKVIIRLAYDKNMEEWILSFKNNQSGHYVLLNTSVVTTVVMILHFREKTKCQYQRLILFPDSLGKDAFRRLCVFLLL